MLNDQKLPSFRCPHAIIGYAVWMYHRFTHSDRDIEDLLLERGICVNHESIRTWGIKFSDLSARGLRHFDEMHVEVGGVRHWVWRTVDEHGTVLDVVLQGHRDAGDALSFLQRLLGEYDVPELIHTDKPWSYGALRDLSVLHSVEHVQAVSTARWNNLIHSLIGRSGGRDVRSHASVHDNGHRAVSICTPRSRTCTIQPAPPFPLALNVPTSRLRSSRDGRWYGRWPESRAGCL